MKLASYLRRYVGRLTLFMVATLLQLIFTMATALSVADFLKLLFEGGAADTSVTVMPTTPLAIAQQQLYDLLLLQGPQRALVLFAVLLLLVYTAKNVFGYMAALQASVVRSCVVRDLRDEMHRKLLHLPMSQTVAQRRGDLLSRFSSDLAEFDETLLASLQSIIVAIFSLVCYLAMLFFIQVRLTLFVLCLLPVVVLGVSRLGATLKRKSLRLQQQHAQMMSDVEETMAGQREVKAHAAAGHFFNRFSRLNDDYTQGRVRMFRRIYAASPVSDTLCNLIVMAVLLYGSALVFDLDAGLTPELFVSYIMMVVLMLPPGRDLSTAFTQLKKGKACQQRLDELLKREERSDVTQGEPYEGLKQGLSVRNLCFDYGEGIVLKDVNFDMPIGSITALVGASGSGKSTLADILSLHYPYSEGSILVDGRELSTLRHDHWHAHLGVVSQRSLLFNDTIAHNIAFSKPDATPQQIEEVARMADAHNFILEQPDGYDTMVGDGGSLLSGGQRQRISIARALLTQPDFIILDEATSALDAQSERQVQRALLDACQGRTALIIAHRLSTVTHADQILVLHEGRIVERGTHSQLLAQNGRYAAMCRGQLLSNFSDTESEQRRES